MGPSGLDTSLQSMLMRNKCALWSPAGNGTTITAIGAVALTPSGTATTANVATGNRHVWQKRVDFLATAAATNAIAGYRYAALQWGRGASPGDGGFLHVFRFGPATGSAVATTRCFVGMAASTGAPTDVNPSTQTNIVGAGWDAGDATISIMSNDASGAAVKIDLGASFPRPTVDRTKSYELALFCPPNANWIGWQFTDLDEGGATAMGSLSAKIPAPLTLLAPRGWISVGGTSSVVGLALMIGGIETDF